MQTVGVHANNIVNVDITGMNLTHKHFFVVLGALATLPVSTILLQQGRHAISPNLHLMHALSCRAMQSLRPIRALLLVIDHLCFHEP